MRFDEFLNEGFVDKVKSFAAKAKNQIVDLKNRIAPSVPKTLSDAFDKYVPAEGKADTVYGEICRALSKILYRWKNDGDMFTKGYGLETALSSAVYLYVNVPSMKKILADVGNRVHASDDFYDSKMQELVKVFEGMDSDTVKSLVRKKNTVDSLDLKLMLRELNEELFIDIDGSLSDEVENYVSMNWAKIVDGYIEDYEEGDRKPTLGDLEETVHQEIDTNTYRKLGADMGVIQDYLRNSGILDEILRGIEEKLEGDDDE